ncbi:MAG: hypothetical protein IKA77_03215 [Clostridia bacterium]|nr:hypothetical protein [Clostridia bacterium]
MKKFLVCALVLVICLTAFVACKDKGADLEDLNRAKEFLSTHLNGMKEVTGKDYKLPAVVVVDGVTYTVTWTLTVNTGSDTVVSLGSVENSLQTINIDEFASAEATYTLTATIADENGNTVTVTANRKVPKFVVNTYAEYVAGCAADDRETIYMVKGYVIGVNAAPLSGSKGSVWIMDEDGHGYYAYKAAQVEGIDYSTRESINAAFPLGTEVVIKGKATNYKGGNQFAEGCEIILTGNSTDVATKFPYVDQTALWGSAANGSDHTKLADTQSTRISLTNVTLGSNSGKNYTFTVNGVEFIWYMDVYLVDDATRDAFIAKWVKGKTANIKGVVNTFSGNYQVYPDGADSLQIIEENLNDAQKVAKEKENLTLEELYRENFTLPEGTWTDIEWAITGTGATLGANNLVTINRTSADQTVTITATITSGTESDTKEFSVTIPAVAAGVVVGTPYTITANNDNGPIYFNGQVNSGRFSGSTAAADAAVVYVEAASNAGEYYLYMTDGTTKTYICMNDEAAGAKLITTVANATIYEWNEVLSTLVVADDNNNRAFGAGGTFTNFSCYDISGSYSWGQFVVYIPADPDAPVSDDAKISAEKAALTFAVKEYTENGTAILPVVGATYPEVAIAWSSEATELAIDGANLTITVGTENKVVTLTATISCGNATAATKDFSILINVKVVETIEEALSAPVGVSASFSGQVASIKSPWNTQYSNMDFFVSDGTNQILVYRAGTKVKVGDEVTVEGAIAAHQGVNQIAPGATVTITASSEEEEEVITTIADALVAANVGKSASFSGQVVSIKSAWSAQYSNMDFFVSDGTNQILVYRAGTQVKVGDTVSIEGAIGTHNDVNQIAPGATVTITEAHVCAYDDATCEAPATCPVCGATTGEALVHTDVNPADGVCDKCSTSMSSLKATATYSAGATANMTGENDAATLGLNATIFSAISTKTGNNHVGLNKDGTLRLYSKASCELTISIAANYEIVSIKVTTVSAEKSANGVLTVTDGTNTITAEAGVYAVNGNSVVLKNTSDASSNNQVWISSIEIVYALVA